MVAPAVEGLDLFKIGGRSMHLAEENGAGPNVEVHRSDPAEQGSVIGTEPERAAQHAYQQQNTTETVGEWEVVGGERK